MSICLRNVRSITFKTNILRPSINFFLCWMYYFLYILVAYISEVIYRSINKMYKVYNIYIVVSLI